MIQNNAQVFRERKRKRKRTDRDNTKIKKREKEKTRQKKNRRKKRTKDSINTKKKKTHQTNRTYDKNEKLGSRGLLVLFAKLHQGVEGLQEVLDGAGPLGLFLLQGHPAKHGSHVITVVL